MARTLGETSFTGFTRFYNFVSLAWGMLEFLAEGAFFWAGITLGALGSLFLISSLVLASWWEAFLVLGLTGISYGLHLLARRRKPDQFIFVREKDLPRVYLELASLFLAFSFSISLILLVAGFLGRGLEPSLLWPTLGPLIGSFKEGEMLVMIFSGLVALVPLSIFFVVLSFCGVGIYRLWGKKLDREVKKIDFKLLAAFSPLILSMLVLEVYKDQYFSFFSDWFLKNPTGVKISWYFLGIPTLGFAKVLFSGFSLHRLANLSEEIRGARSPREL